MTIGKIFSRRNVNCKTPAKTLAKVFQKNVFFAIESSRGSLRKQKKTFEIEIYLDTLNKFQVTQVSGARERLARNVKLETFQRFLSQMFPICLGYTQASNFVRFAKQYAYGMLKISRLVINFWITAVKC